MLMRSHFTVDLWFIFGSFCYGAEASIVSCTHDTVALRIAPASSSAQAELLTFFEQVREKSKSLVRTEIRIFVNNNPVAEAQDDWAEELVTTLMTDDKPKIEARSDCLDLELTEICGLTSSDQTTWVNLVTDIWPQLHS